MQITDNAKEVVSNMYTQTAEYVNRLLDPDSNKQRRERVFNPICPVIHQDAEQVKICVYDYSKSYVQQHELKDIKETFN